MGDEVTRRDNKDYQQGTLRRVLGLLLLECPFRLSDLYPVQLKKYHSVARVLNHLRIIDDKEFGKVTNGAPDPNTKRDLEGGGVYNSARQSDENYDHNHTNFPEEKKKKAKGYAKEIEKVSERSERALLKMSILAMNQHPRNGYRRLHPLLN
jgi:hypothetical protein